MSEIEQVIETRVLTEQSKKNYRNYYRKIKGVLGKDIHITEQEDLISMIDDISNDKVSNKLAFVNICMLVNNLYDSPVDLLNEYRFKLFAQRDKDNTAKKELDLPEYKDVKKYIDGLTGVKYIVNYLIFTYGVRNKDVNVFITNRKLAKNIDDENNYLIIKNKEIEWVRNDYKTVQSYLQQRIVIKAKKFMEIVKSLPLETWLLSGTATPISPTSLNNTVSRMLYKYKDKHMSEGEYFKLNVKHLQTQTNSYTKILKLGSIRGTNPETIEGYYNLSK